MNARDDLIIQIEILPLHYTRKAHATKIVEGAESFRVHPVGQSIGQVLNNAESVMHGRRATCYLSLMCVAAYAATIASASLLPRKVMPFGHAKISSSAPGPTLSTCRMI